MILSCKTCVIYINVDTTHGIYPTTHTHTHSYILLHCFKLDIAVKLESHNTQLQLHSMTLFQSDIAVKFVTYIIHIYIVKIKWYHVLNIQTAKPQLVNCLK